MKEKTVHPNREFKWYRKIQMSHITRMEEIENAMEADVKDAAQSDNQQIRESVDDLKQQSQQLQQQLKNMEDMIRQLLRAK